MLSRDDYLAAWSRWHGDTSTDRPLVRGWLTVAWTLARPVAGLPPLERYLFIEGGELAIENCMKEAMDWKVRKNMAVGRGEPGSRAAMAVTVDEPVPGEVLEALLRTPGFNQAWAVTL